MPADGSRAPVRRVMITAAGTVTAQSVIKALHEDGRAAFVAAGDMNPLNATRAFVDAFVELPPASSAHFAQTCFEAARRLQIDLLVPLIVESEFLPLDDARALFESIGCRLALPAREIVLRTGDKLEFANFLRSIGVPGPATLPYTESISVERFPVYLKPRRGSGSVGTSRVESRHSLHEAARGRHDLIVQEAVDGTEFTVDCFAAEPGRVVAAVPRERIAIKAGVSVKGRTYRHPLIERIARDVVEKSELTGPANVQGMLRSDGSFSIIEMNPRFSGNACADDRGGNQFRVAADRHDRRQADTGSARPPRGRARDDALLERSLRKHAEGAVRLDTALQALRRDDARLAPKLESEGGAHERMVEPLGTPVADQSNERGGSR